jgi:glutamate synthase (NADPH/NADH) large chain
MPKFKKVMPVEYRKALALMAKAQATDKDGLAKIEIGLKMAKA